MQDHESYGIAVLPNIDRTVWVTRGNEVRDNVVRASGLADLALGGPAAGTDCFEGNDAGRTAPPAISLLRGCDSSLAGIGGGSIAPTLNAAVRFLDALDGSFPHGDWRTQPVPPDQPTMPDPENAPPRPAVPEQSVPQPYRIRAVGSIDPALPSVDKELSRVRNPARHLVVEPADRPLRVRAAGHPLRRLGHDRVVGPDQAGVAADLVPGARWMAVVLLAPFAGPLLYFAFGRSPIPSQLRLVLTVGGLVATLSVSALAALLGG